MHDELGCNIREAKVLKVGFKKIPVNIIKRLFKIKLEGRITFFLLRSSHKMNDFLQNNNIIISAST